jgi:subtilisin family serine protease
VIDTGVDPTQPVLQGLLLAGRDFTRNQDGGSELADVSQSTMAVVNGAAPVLVNQSTMAVVNDTGSSTFSQPQYAAFGHGTMVSGIIHLVAPTALIMPLKSFHADGTGYLADVLKAIYYARLHGANILSMSFDFTTYSDELAHAINDAVSHGLICVASVGNDGQAITVYPAGLTNVIGVASTANDDTLSSFSNFGQPPVWLGAPGEGIITTYPYGTYAAGWGTSFSTPFVAGTVALLRSVSTSLNQTSAAQAISNAVYISSALGHGRLDIRQAVAAWCATTSAC